MRVVVPPRIDGDGDRVEGGPSGIVLVKSDALAAAPKLEELDKTEELEDAVEAEERSVVLGAPLTSVVAKVVLRLVAVVVALAKPFCLRHCQPRFVNGEPPNDGAGIRRLDPVSSWASAAGASVCCTYVPSWRSCRWRGPASAAESRRACIIKKLMCIFERMRKEGGNGGRVSRNKSFFFALFHREANQGSIKSWPRGPALSQTGERLHTVKGGGANTIET